MKINEKPVTPDELNALAEDRWTTVRHLVWQGWISHQDISDEEKQTLRERGFLLHDAARVMLDEDGGVWFEAQPEECEREGKHEPRWHPAEFYGHNYCTRCGAQGV